MDFTALDGQFLVDTRTKKTNNCETTTMKLQAVSLLAFSSACLARVNMELVRQAKCCGLTWEEEMFADDQPMCMALLPAFAYDPEKQDCYMYQWGGCPLPTDMTNFFYDQEDCEAFCQDIDVEVCHSLPWWSYLGETKSIVDRARQIAVI